MKEDNIYKKLKTARKERGLTLATLADKIGSDYQQLSRIERGKSRLTVDVLMKMANALDVPIGELIKPQDAEKLEPVGKSEGISSDRLGEILEKLEELLQETKSQVPPQSKAALASLIYTETLSNSAALPFAMNIVRALLIQNSR